MATQVTWGDSGEGGRPPTPAEGGSVLRFSGGGGSGTVRNLPPERLAVLGAWLLTVPVTMLFLAFGSAYIVRQGLGGGDWLAVELPRLFLVNTVVILLSAVTLEFARRAARQQRSSAPWLWVSALLGSAFLVGQFLAWGELQARGLAVGTTPHGSFVYLFTGAHAVHVVLGILALVAAALWPEEGWFRTPREGAVGASAVYWHCMGILWVGIFALLIFGR